MTARRGAPLTPPDDPPDDDDFGDPLTPEEVNQAAAGSLFSIQGPEFERVTWSISRFRTRAELAADPQGQAEEWVADRAGELHGAELSDALGGGTFRFRGYVPRSDGRGVRLAFNRVIALAGARRSLNEPPPAPPVTPPPGNGSSELTALLTRMDARLERLERTPAAQPTSLTDMVQAMVGLHGLTAANGGKSDSQTALEMFKAMGTALETGIAIGEQREPKPSDDGEGGGVLPVVNKALEVFQTMLEARRAPASRPAAAPPSASPHVANTPPGPAPASTAGTSEARVVDLDEQIAQARTMTVVDLLARAVREGEDAADVAGTIERVLPDDALSGFLAVPDDVLVVDIARRAGIAYPELATDSGKALVRAVLTELRTPPTE